MLNSDQKRTLLQAWVLHSEGRIKELIDPTLDLQQKEESEAIRIISVALLCVHRSGDRRPDMKAVVAMLHGGMDTEVAKLVLEHESDRFSSSRGRGRGSLGHSASSSGVSSLMSRGDAVTLTNQASLAPLIMENEPPSEMLVQLGSGLDATPRS